MMTKTRLLPLSCPGKSDRNSRKWDKDVTLTPSRQSIFDRVTGKLETKQTDVQAALAWKEGKIIANNERLEDIFRQLSRWYDFKVVYTQPSLKDVRFYLHSKPVCGSTYNSGISPNNERDSFHLC